MLNAMLVAVGVMEVTVTVDDPDERSPVAIIDGVELNAGVKLIVAIEPEIVYIYPGPDPDPVAGINPAITLT